MFKFPKTEPEITITDLPDDQFEVFCRDDQSGFVLLEPGEDVEFAFYDYPPDAPDRHPELVEGSPEPVEGHPEVVEGPLVFTGAHRLRVGNRIMIEGVEALETDWWYAEAGSDYADRSGTTYNVLNDKGHRIAGWIQRYDPEKWAYERYEMTPLPALLRPGLKASGHERVIVGDEVIRESEISYEVVGAARVMVGPKAYRCLKVMNSYANAQGRESLAEYYVSDTGRTIYFRRYDGPASSRYSERLKDKPTLEYNGVTWRHFYNCLPDHALIVGW